MGTVRLLLLLVCYSASAQLPVIPWRIPPSSSFTPSNFFGTNLLVWFEATDAKVNTGKTHPLAQGDTVTNWVVNSSRWDKSGVQDKYEVWWANSTGFTWWTNGGGSAGNQARVAFSNTVPMVPVTGVGGTLGESQPITMALVCNTTMASGSGECLIGDTGNGLLFRRDSDNSFSAFAGTDLHSGAWTDTAFRYIVCVYTNGGSLIRTNGIQVTSGNSGTTSFTHPASGNFLFGSQSANVNPWKGSVCRLAMWLTNASPAQITNIENWCINDFGFPAHP